MKTNNVLELIGNTPLVKINTLFGTQANVWVKLEQQNPGGSIKDRVALAMIEDAERKGLLTKGDLIVEPTSGNTGIGLAMVAAVKGYRLILVMPDSMSVEKRKILSTYGVELVLTPKEKGMKGAIENANEIARDQKGWMPMQFENLSNPDIHTRTTALEIWNDLGNSLDYLVAGVGTGGHISGVSKFLKQRIPHLQTIAIEPEEFAVISGGEPGPHKLQGIGAGFLPKNLDVNILDDVVKISTEEVYDFTRKAAKQEGLFIGISSGASLAAIHKLLPEIGNKTVLSFAYDGGERYLSTEGLF